MLNLVGFVPVHPRPYMSPALTCLYMAPGGFSMCPRLYVPLNLTLTSKPNFNMLTLT